MSWRSGLDARVLGATRIQWSCSLGRAHYSNPLIDANPQSWYPGTLVPLGRCRYSGLGRWQRCHALCQDKEAEEIADVDHNKTY